MVSYWTVFGCALAYLRISRGWETPLHRYNAMITRCIFVYANGALVWSVAIFRNSLVFYSIDQVTSVFIHLSPALLCWCTRWGGGQGIQMIEEWFPGMFEVCPGISAQQADECLKWSRLLTWCTECEVGVKGFLLQPVMFYVLAWALPYYLFHFCFFKDYIERSGKETLYALVMGDKSKSRLIRLLPEPLHPLGYLLQHFALVAVLGLMTMVFWSNFVLHTAFIAFMIVIAVHNGSTYTFRVFGLRYADSVLKKHKDEILPGRLKRLSTGAMAYQSLRLEED